MKKLLHVGCGNKNKCQTTHGFNSSNWQEIRFDVDVSVNPDVIGTMTNMSAINTASIDAIYSSHNIEHLYAHEIPLALSEFIRILRPDGFCVITCPDLQSVAKLIADGKLLEPAYTSPAGPIAPFDILYGLRAAMARGNLYMAHRSGFTQNVLHSTLSSVGFKSVATAARGFAPFFDLWALASKSERSNDEMRCIASDHFPR